ncbi:MAG: ComF family protein [Candidatus Altimarinota bacterium]
MLTITKHFLLDLLFPRQCISCKKLDTWLCDACFRHFKPTIYQVCYLCRRPSEKAKTCKNHQIPDPKRQLDRMIVAAHYSSNPILKKAIHTLKYGRKPDDIAEKLGELLAQTLAFHLSIFHYPRCVLIPIPLHPKRLKSRGYNQAQLLAKHIERPFSKLLTTNSELIIRPKETTSQVSSATRAARLENLKGAFELNGKVDSDALYILIDDVVTTGATLEECCSILKLNGAKEVWGLVLARN